MFFLAKKDWVKFSELFPTLKKSKSKFPSFIQQTKWQRPTFRIYSNHEILQSIFQTFPPSKTTKSNFPHLFPPLKMTKFNFPNFSANKNDKVQLSELFLPIKMIMSNFPNFFRHKKLQSSNFRTFSDLKNGKVQISKLFPNISELIHSEFRTLYGISCYG